MSTNLKAGLMGLIAVALVVNGYFLWKKSIGGQSTPERTGVVANTGNGTNSTASTDSKTTIKPADGAEKNYTVERSVEPATPPVYDDPTTLIAYESEAHDFGTVQQNSENEYTFKFTNTGTNPLVIYKAKGSCGCTVPDYPKEPIAPGEEGEIKVVYKPGKQKNAQTKFVTVTANTEPGESKLKITANVEVPAGEEG